MKSDEYIKYSFGHNRYHFTFNAFSIFSGSETALMSISRIRLKHLASTKSGSVRNIQAMLRKPEKLIGTILLGNNLVNVA